MYVMSHNVFEKMGDRWNARNEQRPTGLIIREVRGPNWHELTHRFRIEGYGPDGEPTKAQPRPHVPSPKGKCVHDEARRACAKAMPKGVKFAPSGEHYHRKEELRGKAKPLSEEQQLLRKKQRAQVKARLTRAQNRLAKEREEIWSIILGL